MSRPDVATAEEWLKHARSDLALARLAYHRADVLPEQVCFHAQQAGEKSITAVLLSRGIDFPRVHDLDELVQLARAAGLEIPPELDEAGTLSPYAVEARYPSEDCFVDDAEVLAALDLASKLLAWAGRVTADPSPHP